MPAGITDVTGRDVKSPMERRMAAQISWRDVMTFPLWRRPEPWPCAAAVPIDEFLAVLTGLGQSIQRAGR